MLGDSFLFSKAWQDNKLEVNEIVADAEWEIGQRTRKLPQVSSQLGLATHYAENIEAFK